jgi:transcriptional regulator with XRE-family HTH domain
VHQVSEKIPEEVLTEQWYGFVQNLIGNMQSAFRSANITQKAMASRLGKKESFISRCLSGQQNMTVRTIFMIARAMGYRLEIKFQKVSSLRPTNNRPPAEIGVTITSSHPKIVYTEPASNTATAAGNWLLAHGR